MSVFGRSAQFDTSQDSTVRVHIHRLRRRLDTFNHGKGGKLLHIPKGDYRLVLSEVTDSPDDDDGFVAEAERALPAGQSRTWTVIAACLALSVIVWGGLFLSAGIGQPATSTLAQTTFWAPIATQKRKPLIAAGDFYMVVESGPDGTTQRLAMRPAIRSGRDLDKYLRMHPDEYSKLRDRDIHRLPAPTAMGAAQILPIVASVRSDHAMPEIIPVSQVSQDTVDSNDIIYIDRFSELGMLRSPVLEQSQFAPGKDPTELRDVPSGRTFTARAAPRNEPGADGTSGDRYGYDYGYLASYPGPSGNRIIVIAGMEDAALAQMVRLVSDKGQLDTLSRRTGDVAAFEALYQVRTSGGLIFDTALLIARPLEKG